MSTNNASVSAVNVDNAPLDVAKLSVIGRYQLRRLAEELTRNGIPLVDTEERKTSFMSLPSAQAMAETVFEGLKKYREANGEDVSKAKATPSQQELVAAVTAPPVEAAPVEEVKPKRSPRTASEPVAKAEEPASEAIRTQVQPQAVVNQALAAEVFKAVEATKSLTSQVAVGFGELKMVIQAYTAQTETIRDLDERTANLEKKMDLALGLLSLIAENVLNVSQNQVVRDALEAAESIEDLLPKALARSSEED